MLKPPENWEDIKEFEDRCTCKEYEWEDHGCQYQIEINDNKDAECNCW